MNPGVQYWDNLNYYAFTQIIPTKYTMSSTFTPALEFTSLFPGNSGLCLRYVCTQHGIYSSIVN